MAHTSQKRWNDVSESITRFCSTAVIALNEAEEAYQQFQEIYSYAGSTDQGLADLLFIQENGYDSAGDPIPANATQLAMATDAKNAMVQITYKTMSI